MDFLAAGLVATMSLRKAANSAEVCRSAAFPKTSPVLVWNAVYYKESVPCR
jgi:hypothetical protein